MTTDKHNETKNAFSIDDVDSEQLSLILKSFVRMRENEIWFEYYYNNIDDFSSEKEIDYLNKVLKAAKFNQKKWLKPGCGVYHATFNYSEIICGKNFNFNSRIVIRR